MGSESQASFAFLRPPASLQIKPGLSYRWTNSQGARMELRAEGRYTDHQWSANTWLAFQRGPWSLQGQLSVPAPSMDRVVSLQLASAQIGRTDRHFDIRLAWAFSQADFLWQSRDPTPLHQARATARWTLPGSLAPLQLSGGGTFDLHSTRWFNRMLGLSYTHPTGCVRLQVEGYLSTDRVLPDLVTRIELRPGSKRSSSR